MYLLMKFGLRWLVSTLGLWIAAALLGPERLSVNGSWSTLLIAGLVLALVNMVLKPILVILSIPAIILSVGLFMLVVNGFIVLIVSWLYDPLYVKNLGVAIIAGLVIGLVNFLTTRVLKEA